MPDPASPEGPRYANQIPITTASVFRTDSRLAPFAIAPDGHPIVPVYDVKDSTDRKNWIFDHLHLFWQHPGVATYREDQSGAWRQFRTSWEGSLDEAVQGANLDLDGEEKTETEQFLKAAMATMVAGIAMDNCAGSLESAIKIICGGYPDRADIWTREILCGHPEFHKQLLRDPVIKYFYERTLNDSCMVKIEHPSSTGSKGWTEYTLPPDREDYVLGRVQIPKLSGGGFDYVGSSLTRCLTAEDNEGFDPYVKEIVRNLSQETITSLHKAGYNDKQILVCAKLGATIFQTSADFTWYEYLVGEAAERKGVDIGRIKSSVNSGGNPLFPILNPSHLVVKVKGMFGQDHPAVEMLNKAFRPIDLLRQVHGEGYQLTPSLTEGLKRLNRWAEALSGITGSARGAGLMDWGRDGAKAVSDMSELLQQVFDRVETTVNGQKRNISRDLQQVIVARAILAKIFALTGEMRSNLVKPDGKPNVTGIASWLMGDSALVDKGLFAEARLFLLGTPGVKDGFLHRLQGDRTGFPDIDKNFFPEARQDVELIADTLVIGQDARGVSKTANLALKLGKLFIAVASADQKRR